MITAGIVCEYNPFHNGHRYHIEKTRESANACICVMSGNFTQRGRPAIADKFTRAHCAVSGGADLVLELPAVFAVRSAETFARGAIGLLDALGCVDLLSFGCECGSLSALEKAAELLSREGSEFQALLKTGLSDGLSFPAARERAVRHILGDADTLTQPNDILAVEYLKWLKRYHSSIRPMAVQRSFIGYHSTEPEGKYASASYLRSHPEELERYTDVADVLRDCPHFPVSPANLDTVILATLRKMTVEQIAGICDCTEGLENRIKQAVNEAGTLDELIELVKTKRYTHTRIERLLTCSLLGIQKTEYPLDYIRVLAMNRTGRALLREIKKRCRLPVITNLSKQQIDSPSLTIDLLAGDLYSLLYDSGRQAGMDYTTSPYVEE